MNNTAHFGITETGTLVALGVGADTKDVGNLLADNVESVAAVKEAPISIVALVNISDLRELPPSITISLYRLKGEITDALNALDNEALGGVVETFGT